MNEEDVDFINIHLDEFEKSIFFKLKENEQKHSVRVAKLVILTYKEKNEYFQINLDRIIRAALLHDVGKSLKKINIIQKVFMVLANKLFNEKIIRLINFKFIDSYYNHPNMSYSILKDYIKDERLLFLIKNHHSKITQDIELNLLKYCDDKN